MEKNKELFLLLNKDAYLSVDEDKGLISIIMIINNVEITCSLHIEKVEAKTLIDMYDYYKKLYNKSDTLPY